MSAAKQKQKQNLCPVTLRISLNRKGVLMSQEIAVAFIVVGAVVYLARTVWLQSRGKSCGCGKSGCAPKTATRNSSLPSHLVQIQNNTSPNTARDKAHLN